HSWVVTRYEDVKVVLTDRRFSTELQYYRDAPTELPDEQLTSHQLLAKHGLFWTPTVDHARIRRVLAPMLAARAPETFRSATRHVFDEVLARVDGSARLDIA